jgi:RmlD substrate binding domain
VTSDIVFGCTQRPDTDLLRPASIAQALAEFRPDIVINPAASTAVDKAESEPEQAFALPGRPWWSPRPQTRTRPSSICLYPKAISSIRKAFMYDPNAVEIGRRRGEPSTHRANKLNVCAAHR